MSLYKWLYYYNVIRASFVVKMLTPYQTLPNLHFTTPQQKHFGVIIVIGNAFPSFIH